MEKTHTRGCQPLTLLKRRKRGDDHTTMISSALVQPVAAPHDPCTKSYDALRTSTPLRPRDAPKTKQAMEVSGRGIFLRCSDNLAP